MKYIILLLILLPLYGNAQIIEKDGNIILNQKGHAETIFIKNENEYSIILYEIYGMSKDNKWATIVEINSGKKSRTTEKPFLYYIPYKISIEDGFSSLYDPEFYNDENGTYFEDGRDNKIYLKKLEDMITKRKLLTVSECTGGRTNYTRCGIYFNTKDKSKYLILDTNEANYSTKLIIANNTPIQAIIKPSLIKYTVDIKGGYKTYYWHYTTGQVYETTAKNNSSRPELSHKDTNIPKDALRAILESYTYQLETDKNTKPVDIIGSYTLIPNDFKMYVYTQNNQIRFSIFNDDKYISMGSILKKGEYIIVKIDDSKTNTIDSMTFVKGLTEIVIKGEYLSGSFELKKISSENSQDY
ncbi:MAG: hypothetical protein V7765_05925 [Oleispira sp.]|jgi:hypothetical protein